MAYHYSVCPRTILAIAGQSQEAIVDDSNLDVLDVFLDNYNHFLIGHLEATITTHHPHGVFRMRPRQPKAAGMAKPMVPAPPLVICVRGRYQSSNWAAAILMLASVTTR
jgi:hypothetical protein